MGLLRWHSGKESSCQYKRLGFDPWLGRSPGVGNGNSLQYSCQENSMDRKVHGVTKSQTRLNDWHTDTHAHIHTERQYENVLYYKKYFHETREEFLPLSFFFSFTLADDKILFDDFWWENIWSIQKAVDSIIMHTLYLVPRLTNESF